MVLAAGRARRFGAAKLDALCHGKPLGRWVLDSVAVAGLAPGVIVTGPEAPEFARSADGWRLLANPSPDAGLGTSLALAAHDAMEGGAAALLILLADMPLVGPSYIKRIAAAQAPAATRQGDGRAGVPALIPAAMFPALAQLDADRGAGMLLEERENLTLLDPPRDMLVDVDRPEDLERAARLLAERIHHRL